MVGIGTGFNKEIKENLFSFLRACYAGLREQVALGMPPGEGLAREFREIGQYRGLLSESAQSHSPSVDSLLQFLEHCYKGIDRHINEDLNLDEAITREFQSLEQYIDSIESTQKQRYGSIWDQVENNKSPEQLQ